MSNYPQPPAHNWASTHDRPAQTSWVAPMIVGAVIFAAGCAGGLVADWFAGVANSFSETFGFEPFDATLAIEAPSQVLADETFEIVVSITDTSGSDRTVRDIDFESGLAEGLTVVSVSPTPDSTSRDTDYVEHTFDAPLLANQTGVYTFTVRPSSANFIEGTLSVYLDGYTSEIVFLTIDVGGSPAEQPEPDTPAAEPGRATGHGEEG